LNTRGDDPDAEQAQVWLASGHTDMRKGFDGLAVLVQQVPSSIRIADTCSCARPTTDILHTDDDRLPMASIVRPDRSGGQSAEQGSETRIYTEKWTDLARELRNGLADRARAFRVAAVGAPLSKADIGKAQRLLGYIPSD
jgi:IS66 Orf2 like protein